MALLQFKLKTSADIKQNAFTEHDHCVSDAQTTYMKRWASACKSNGLDPDCTLAKEGPGLNLGLKEQKAECKQRFDMRMQP